VDMQNTVKPKKKAQWKTDRYGNTFLLGDTILYAVRDTRTALMKEGVVTQISPKGFPCVTKGKPIKSVERVVNLTALLRNVKNFEKILDNL